MSTQKTRIKIKLTSGEQITVQDLPKNKIKKALLERVLPAQVPDAELLSVCDTHGSVQHLDEGAFERFGLSLKDYSVLPDVVAYSENSDTLLFIETIHGHGSIDRSRYAELCHWTRDVKCRTAFVSVFASRGAYAKQFSSTVMRSHIWFADAPRHSVSTSSTTEEAMAIMERHVAYHAECRQR